MTRSGSGLRLLSAVVLASGLAGVTAFTIAASADEIASKAITCEEKIPPGSTRPTITEKFPGTATAGYEASVANMPETTLTTDNVFRDDNAVRQLATVTGDVAAGFLATLAIAV